jgi:hypothetical protein
MPANAMWYAALAGVMFHRGVGAGERAVGRREAARLDVPRRAAR